MQSDPKVFGVDNRKNGVAIYCDGKNREGTSSIRGKKRTNRYPSGETE